MSTMRLIDANALAEKAYWHGEHPTVDNPFAEGVEAVDMRDIDEIPTIEAEPVRHGRVIVHDGFEDEYYEYCSECKSRDVHIGDNYCPNCGVKLDKEA